jgi:hypothetical protein
MLGQLGVNQFTAAHFQRRESAFLINAHQAAIACNIGRKNCC